MTTNYHCNYIFHHSYFVINFWFVTEIGVTWWWIHCSRTKRTFCSTRTESSQAKTIRLASCWLKYILIAAGYAVEDTPAIELWEFIYQLKYLLASIDKRAAHCYLCYISISYIPPWYSVNNKTDLVVMPACNCILPKSTNIIIFVFYLDIKDIEKKPPILTLIKKRGSVSAGNRS